MQQEEAINLLEAQGVKVHYKLFKETDQPLYMTLNNSSLQLKPEENGRQRHLTINLRDIIGVHIKNITGDVYQIKINCFPIRKGWLSKPRRTIQTLLLYTEQSKYDMRSLQLSLLKAITNRQIKDPQQLRLLAYFNPAAGANSRKQLNLLQKFIQYTNFTLEIFQTQRRSHCKQHLDTLDLSPYQGILIISGDGLMHEFVNSKACGKIPVSHIPAGSGNAFAKTHTMEAAQDCTTEISAFLAVKGKTKPFNTFKVELENKEQPVYSFLSLQWALIADVDINSQFLRCLGGLRFEIWAVYRLISMIRYPGKLTYSYQDSPLPPLNQPITDQNFRVMEGDFLNTVFTYIPWISVKYNQSPLLRIEDKAIDMQVVLSEHGRFNLLQYLLRCDSGDNFDLEKREVKEGRQFGWAKIKSFRLEPLGDGQRKGIFGIDGQNYESQKIQVSLSDRQLIAFV